MAGLATGVFKRLSFKKQTGQGVKATAGAAGSAAYMRRVTSTLDLKKATYTSNEMLPSQQKRDMRHGVRSVAGTINGELSVGGYQKPIESVLRQLVQPVIASAALTNVTAASTGTYFGTFTRAAGSWITDGFNIGDVCVQSGWTAPATDNNAQNFVIIGLTATVITVAVLDKTPIVAKASGDSITTTMVGKKTWIPATGQTRDYYTINHWHSDIGQSEEYKDCVFTGMNISLPPTGLATIEFPVMGLDMDTGQAEYFTTPAAAPAGGILAAVNGMLVMNGIVAGVVTGLTINVNGNYSVPGGVVGSNTDPDIFPGSIDVTGQITVLFADTTFRDAFLNETESSVIFVGTANNTAQAPFTAFVMSRVKYTGADKNDGNAGLTLTMPFTALENVLNGGAGLPNLQTTISIQDSAFA